MAQATNCKRDLLKHVGDINQIFGIRESILNSGKAHGVRAMDIKNGAGLEFTVLPDRCLDIASLSFKGCNLSYLSKSGIVAPQYYQREGIEFLRSFFAGFLTTCGLRNVGAPCEDGGETFGLHGSISNVPAEEVSARTDWSLEVPVVKIAGQMREARLFGENLVMHREISVMYGQNKLLITDQVENQGFAPEPLMLMYHFNLGYPLLSEFAELVAPVHSTLPRNPQADSGLLNFRQCQSPSEGYLEQVFDHDLVEDSKGWTCTGLVNESLGLGAVIRFNKQELFNLTQWKMMGEGDYVMGIEPGNCLGGGRTAVRQSGKLEWLQPGEIREFSIEVEILEGLDAINLFKSEVAKLEVNTRNF